MRPAIQAAIPLALLASAHAAQPAEVAIRSPDGQARTERLVAGEWFEATKQPPIWLPYRRGRELRFEWKKPRLFVRVDGGARRLVAIRVEKGDGMAALRDAIQKGVSPLVVSCRGEDMPSLRPVPANLDFALCACDGEVREVSTLRARLPGLRALYLSHVSAGPPEMVLTQLAGLERLTSLYVQFGNILQPNLGPLTRLKRLKALDVRWTGLSHRRHWRLYIRRPRPLAPKGPVDLAPLGAMGQLHSLSLPSEMSTDDLGPLRKLKRLVSLRLGECAKDRKEATALVPLGELTQLECLHLGGCDQLADLSALARLTDLIELRLSRTDAVTDLTPLAKLPKLRKLSLRCFSNRKLSDLSPLANLRGLRRLQLVNFFAVRDVSPLAELRGLRELDLGGTIELTDLSPLPRLKNVTHLDLGYCHKLADLGPLAAMPNLRRLELTESRVLTDLRPLARLANLTSLSLELCEKVTDLSPLTTLTRLEQLNLEQCKGVRDLSPLARLLNLRELNLNRCVHISDLRPLEHLAHLSHISLRGCGLVTNAAPLRHAARRGAIINADRHLAHQLEALRRTPDF